MRMPDGTSFPFWEDSTECRRVYHVVGTHPRASDENPGTAEAPFATIGRAAAVLEPGEKVVVHEGVYRETVRPARGGEGPDRMIAYEAAAGEKVWIKGSDVWRPAFRPSEGFRLKRWGADPAAPAPPVWMADLPPEMFVGYNPFMTLNVSAEFWTFTREWAEEEVQRFLMRRGLVFADGRPLRQVFRLAELAESEGAFWVEDPGLRIHLRLWGDADPRGVEFEVTAREQVFAPAERELGYIRISGFGMEHAADGIPVPQRALLSTGRGHHWIIENNRLRWANACGLDVGAETWYAAYETPPGSHIIRRNTISDCGACGIAGPSPHHTLVEDNLIERIGSLNVERIWECAGLKFHTCTGALFRRNVFRHIRHACGLWLDVSNRNCRITDNVFTDIESVQGGVYLECSHDQNLVDRNLFWDIRSALRPPGWRSGGLGVNSDSGENAVIAHNLFGRLEGYAVSLNLNQAERVIDGRVGLCRRHEVRNNVFVHCPKRIYLARAADNTSDGNLFDARGDAVSFCIRYPDPETRLDLDAWQRYYGLDEHSTQARIEAEFDPDEGALTWKVEGGAPATGPVEAMHEAEAAPPGPFTTEEWQRRGGEKQFPLGGSPVAEGGT
jgi:hypothetical protein